MAREAVPIFKQHSLGLLTNRDSWSYNFSREQLAANIARMTNNYRRERDKFIGLFGSDRGRKRSEVVVNDYLAENPDAASAAYIKWSAGLKMSLARTEDITFAPEQIRRCTYRPFNQEYVYFDESLCERRGGLPAAFPTPLHRNAGIAVMGPRPAAQFAALMIDQMPDLALFVYAIQFFPRWTYVRADDDDGVLDFAPSEDVDPSGYRRVDNISDEILMLYRQAAGPEVTKDDIFYYVYGILHDPHYRISYAADLKKMLPRIPNPDSADRFKRVADIGRKLADLHANYEAAEPYSLDVQLAGGLNAKDRETWRVDKMRWRTKTDRSAIVYNAKVTIAGVPDQAHDYMLGSRTALEWIIDRYQVKTDKASGIVNDPNDWCDEHDDPTYIVNLIKKITTVSVETVALVEQLSQ
jgi:predicted helicase